ncbi:MAG: hypothetical protein ACE15C_07675 [Phycisphaerae bacterium]
MNLFDVKEHYALPASVPTGLLFGLALVAIAAWVGMHFLTRRLAPTALRWRALMFAARTAVGFGAMLAVIQAAMRVVLLKTNWALWPIAFGTALAVEALQALYMLERGTISRRWGLAVNALRLSLAVIVAAVLMQPELSLDRSERYKRVVAVLVDQSASMRISDTRMSPAERVRLAEMFSIKEAQRPYRLEAAWRRLEKVRQDLSLQGDWLARVSPTKMENRQTQLEGRREALAETFDQAVKAVDAQLAVVGAPVDGKIKLDDATKAALVDVKANLARQVRDNLAEGMRIVDARNAQRLGDQCGRLMDVVKAAAGALNTIDPKISAVGAAIDEAFFNSLPGDQQGRINAVAQQTRLALAEQVLTHHPVDLASGKAGKSLLEALGVKYEVRTYLFDSQASKIDPTQWKITPPAANAPAMWPTVTASGPGTRLVRSLASQPAGASSTQPTLRAMPVAGEQSTDLAAALKKVKADVPAKQLAGVIILTDGQNNAAERPDIVAGQLAQQQAPICSIVMGAARPPLDAAVVSVQAPRTVYAKDKVYVDAEVKLDGLDGRSARVALWDGPKEVNVQLLTPPSPSFRTHVELADEPQTAGLHSYMVKIDQFEGEVFTENNQFPVTVSVTEEQTRLLIIEGRPRWEFRYLKNLFADRDKTVKLQYVLFQPDQIADSPPRKVVHASAAAQADQPEATALPADEKEWMKFDVIVLGDVDPAHLGKDAQAAIRKFVLDRGGTLIVIAGQYFMPHAYAGTPLGEMLPVVFRQASAASTAPAGADDVFRIALTEEGRDNVFMRLKVDPQESARAWEGVPDLNWRNMDVLGAKPGAATLAYAVGPKAPDFIKNRDDATPPTKEIKDLRREFQAKNALVVMQNVAMGQVLYLNTDRTWRLRYRIGDTFHHKFWGQVLRWATSGKLPAGTDYVKLGADQSRYAPHAQVKVSAKIVTRDYNPVVSNEVAVAVYQKSAGDQLLLRRRMQYVSDSPGVYTANLGELPSGQYRVELEAPAAAPILAPDNVDKVTTEFSVDPATPDELIELSVNRSLLGHLADMGGGVVVDPPQAAATLEALGESVYVDPRPDQVMLWDCWPLLVLITLLATAEWLIRKKVGLP